jgi:hypothetical protein
MTGVPSFVEWHLDALDGATHAGAGQAWLHDPATARRIYDDIMAPKLATQQRTDEIQRLRHEVAALQGELATVGARHASCVRELCRTLFGETGKAGVLDEILDRLDQLEGRTPTPVPLPSANDIHAVTRAGPAMVDRGVRAGARAAPRT